MQLTANGKGYPLRLLVNHQTLLRMKLFTLLITVACINLSAAGYAQKISLAVKDEPLQKVFKLIEKQTEYKFLYTKEQLQNTSHVSFSLKSVTLENLLDQCLKDQPLSYTIVDNI